MAREKFQVPEIVDVAGVGQKEAEMRPVLDKINEDIKKSKLQRLMESYEWQGPEKKLVDVDFFKNRAKREGFIGQDTAPRNRAMGGLFAELNAMLGKTAEDAMMEENRRHTQLLEKIEEHTRPKKDARPLAAKQQAVKFS